MSSIESYRRYAADCMRLAEAERSTEGKDLMLSIALAWVRLAEQKLAVTPKAAAEPQLISLEPAVVEETGAMPRRH